MTTDNDRAQAHIENTARQIATDEAVLGMTPTNDKVDQSGADEYEAMSKIWCELPTCGNVEQDILDFGIHIKRLMQKQAQPSTPANPNAALSHDDICKFMPPEFMFGDALQPYHLRDIISAVRSAPANMPASDAEKVRKGFWDVYEPNNHKRIYVTVFNSAEAESYAENGYKVVEQIDEKASVADYEEVLADHRRLVRELDVALNGEEGAAKQASLCDIVKQVKDSRWTLVAANHKECAKFRFNPEHTDHCDFCKLPRSKHASPQQPVAASSESVKLTDWDRISKAAATACNEYGQWMPERWVQLFVAAYNKE